MAQIELSWVQKLVVIQLAGLTALFPVIGPFLAPVAAVYLIYRMADADLWIVIVAVVVSRFAAAIIGIGIERAVAHFR